MVEVDVLVPVYLFALGCGIAVTYAVHLDSRDDAPETRRRRLRFAVVCALLGLFPLPLFLR